MANNTGTIKEDIAIQQGTRYSRTYAMLNADGTPKNLTGFTGRMHIRATRATIDPPLVEATTANGRVTIDEDDGLVTVTIGADTTAGMTWRSGVYDVEVLSSAANVIRVAEGFAALSLEVTR